MLDLYWKRSSVGLLCKVSNRRDMFTLWQQMSLPAASLSILRTSKNIFTLVQQMSLQAASLSILRTGEKHFQFVTTDVTASSLSLHPTHKRETFSHCDNRCHCRQPLSPSYTQERNIFTLWLQMSLPAASLSILRTREKLIHIVTTDVTAGSLSLQPTHRWETFSVLKTFLWCTVSLTNLSPAPPKMIIHMKT